MRRLLNLSSILLVLGMLIGCASAPKLPETPQQVINEGKETVLAVKRLINQNLSGGFYSASQADQMLNQVEQLERDLNSAQALLASGNASGAGSAAAATRTALLALRTQVEKK